MCGEVMNAVGKPPYCDGNAGFTADTDVVKMHFKCEGPECDGKMLKCSTMAHTGAGRIYPCVLECAEGACTNTTLDCSETAGTCTVQCRGPNSCKELTVKCGGNDCKVSCDKGMTPGAKVNVMPPPQMICQPPQIIACN